MDSITWIGLAGVLSLAAIAGLLAVRGRRGPYARSHPEPNACCLIRDMETGTIPLTREVIDPSRE